MATWAILDGRTLLTSSTSSTISYDFTENTGTSEINYTIKVTSDTGCVSETTYTVPTGSTCQPAPLTPTGRTEYDIYIGLNETRVLNNDSCAYDVTAIFSCPYDIVTDFAQIFIDNGGTIRFDFLYDRYNRTTWFTYSPNTIGTNTLTYSNIRVGDINCKDTVLNEVQIHFLTIDGWSDTQTITKDGIKYNFTISVNDDTGLIIGPGG